MNKLFIFSFAMLVSIVPNVVFAEMPEGIELEQLQEEEQQQQETTELSEAELDGLLSTACSNSNTTSKKTVANQIDKEVDSSISDEKLDILAETVLEIKDLPDAEKSELCEI